MKKYIETKVRYDKTLENGAQKTVTESYLVEAISFAEAEKRIAEEMSHYISGEFIVSAVKFSNADELVKSDRDADDRFFKCKLNFITIDERTAKEKRKAYYIIVQADKLKTALHYLEETMSRSVSDYEVAAITETALLDIYEYEAKADAE